MQILECVKSVIPVMSDKEIELNKVVNIGVDYGGRRGFLVKKAEYSLPLEREIAAGVPDMATLAIFALAFVVLIAIIFIIFKMATRKKK